METCNYLLKHGYIEHELAEKFVILSRLQLQGVITDDVRMDLLKALYKLYTDVQKGWFLLKAFRGRCGARKFVNGMRHRSLFPVDMDTLNHNNYRQIAIYHSLSQHPDAFRSQNSPQTQFNPHSFLMDNRGGSRPRIHIEQYFNLVGEFEDYEEVPKAPDKDSQTPDIYDTEDDVPKQGTGFFRPPTLPEEFIAKNILRSRERIERVNMSRELISKTVANFEEMCEQALLQQEYAYLRAQLQKNEKKEKMVKRRNRHTYVHLKEGATGNIADHIFFHANIFSAYVDETEGSGANGAVASPTRDASSVRNNRGSGEHNSNTRVSQEKPHSDIYSGVQDWAFGARPDTNGYQQFPRRDS
ncbi:hypothetical protein B0O99DRAFT_596053 [Bisporella sp. PMI_857]|nr:hypothetical protein B0O99DRAFT_596053 [Bisporella sp. PMI_857]